MDNLDSINAQIKELEKKRSEIINQELNIKEEEIKKLEWTKKCRAILHINSLSAYGIPTYEISVVGMTPQAYCVLTVFGDNRLQEDNILYKSGIDGSKFFTYSEKTLCQFLDHARFSSLEYPEKHLKVLLAAKQANERYTGKQTKTGIVIKDRGMYYAGEKHGQPQWSPEFKNAIIYDSNILAEKTAAGIGMAAVHVVLYENTE